MIDEVSSRRDSLDVLRGILAFAVMLYHYVEWTHISLPHWAFTVLRLHAVYGVELFFILSGFTLSVASGSLARGNRGEIVRFAIKRFFRIAPVFYLSLGLMMLRSIVLSPESWRQNLPSAWTLVANASLLYGLNDPSLSLVVAGWSIGVEVVFYFLFPLLLVAMSKGRRIAVALFIAAIALAAYHEATQLDAHRPLGDQWSRYVAVQNHLCFFVGGMCIARIQPLRWQIGRAHYWSAVVVALPLCWCIAVTTSGKMDLVMGIHRIAIGAIGFLIVVLTIAFVPPNTVFLRFGLFLGNISYSLHPLHHFSFAARSKLGSRLPASAQLLGAVLLAIGASYLTYHWCEAPFIRMGKQWASRIPVKRVDRPPPPLPN